VGFNLFDNTNSGQPFCAIVPANYYLEQVADFFGCNYLMDKFSVPGSSVLTGLPTSLGIVGEISYFTALYTKDWGIEAICSTHDTYCTGTNKQYATHSECVNFISSLPGYSSVCGSGGVLSGNSTTCRFKHHFMIPLAPSEHCFHVGYGTRIDVQGHFKCHDDLECYAGHPSLSDPNYIDLVTHNTAYWDCLTNNAATWDGLFVTPNVCFVGAAVEDPGSTGSLDPANIAGAVAGGVVGFALVAAVAVIVVRRRKQSMTSKSEVETTPAPTQVVVSQDV